MEGRFSFRAVLFASSGLSLGAALTLAACGMGDIAKPRVEPLVVAPPRDFASGTRLRARFHVIGDLVEVFTTFHDVQLDADCAFEDETGSHVGPGASSYCYPAGLARHREKKGPYLDGACTMLAALTPASGAASYLLVEPYDACTTAPKVYTARPPKKQRTFASDGASGCSADAIVSVQAAGDLLPPDAFVRAVEQIEPRPGRMGARVLVGDDGSRRVVGGFDQARGEAVRAGASEDGVPRWLPARTAFVGGGEPLFFDAACSVPIASKIARTATCPLAAVLVLKGTCGLGSYFELGEAMSSVFRGSATQCTAGPALDVLAFRLGAPIAPESYEPIVTVDVGGALVRRRGIGVSGDVPIAWTDVVAGVTNEPCEVVPSADGALRCLPARSEGVVLFADDACTEPAFARPIGCDIGTEPRFVRDAFEAMPKAYELRRELQVVYETTTRGCREFTPPVTSRSFAVKEIDVTRFPTAVEKME
jgi:hypothetical protein